ncbi:PIN domain-containing protein [Dyadobacter jiangsuensis]|uniref:Putative nucleic acid-binding protein n=1 Tax=Dyadobacter jiangsuensis TaxID=1591085 RepID=A0A2P8FRE9_9BACT|nr:PIN domain-containing protein [Dyadobacter jiangsuensis]PSL24302.1 putative nucleic acid-binding protein [Dyadobacter jiangsuensis]
MRLFIDTNVVLDHALFRATGQPYEAKYILSWADQQRIPMFVSTGSFYTFTYLMHKNGIRKSELTNRLLSYLHIFQIAEHDKASLMSALSNNFRDVEDSFQYQCALKNNCDYLITNNLRDFRSGNNDSLLVMSPLHFLTDTLQKQKGIDF